MKPAITPFIVLTALAAPGCIVGSDEVPMTYDEFVAKHIGTEADATGKVYLHYDWDQPLSSMEQVEQLYAAYRLAKTSGERVSESIVRNVNGQDDIWPVGARNLTYCVADSFAERKGAVVAAMGTATGDWNKASDGAITFAYVPSQDASCTNANTAVTFNVIPVVINSGLIARAFFPSEPRAQRELLVNLPNAFAANPAFPLIGIMRHELGHALGLRHETITPEVAEDFGNQCLENMFYRQVYRLFDDESVMITPACLGTPTVKELNPNLEISFFDERGIQKLY